MLYLNTISRSRGQLRVGRWICDSIRRHVYRLLDPDSVSKGVSQVSRQSLSIFLISPFCSALPIFIPQWFEEHLASIEKMEFQEPEVKLLVDIVGERIRRCWRDEKDHWTQTSTVVPFQLFVTRHRFPPKEPMYFVQRNMDQKWKLAPYFELELSSSQITTTNKPKNYVWSPEPKFEMLHTPGISV